MNGAQAISPFTDMIAPTYQEYEPEADCILENSPMVDSNGSSHWKVDHPGEVPYQNNKTFVFEAYSQLVFPVEDTSLATPRAYLDANITLNIVAPPTADIPPDDSKTIHWLYSRLDTDEFDEDYESHGEELLGIIRTSGKKAIELLEKLIRESSSSTNAFRALELLGSLEHQYTLQDRISLVLQMLQHRKAVVRHGAISGLVSLKAREAIEPLKSLAENDYSLMIRNLAQKALQIILTT
ncbi:hypothetical protein ES703_64991 [subsurface metagenome]